MDRTATTSRHASHSLRRELGLGDLVLAQILCVVGTAWVGVASAVGSAQLTMWIAAILLFYLPMAAVVTCVSRELPLEGGIYQWTRHAFGDLGGFLVAWNVGIYGLLTVATILFSLPTEVAYIVGPSAAWLPENRLASLALTWAVVIILAIVTTRGLEIGKWIHNTGGVAILVVFATLILLPLWGLYRGMPIAWHPVTFSAPPRTLYSLAIFGQMLFGALCGLEYVAILSGESKAPTRTVGLSVILASPVICSMFIFGTSSVSAFAGKDHINFIAPIPQTFRHALGNQGTASIFATVVIVLMQLRILGAVSFLFTGATRLPMTAGWDHLLPRWFTSLHPRWRTPANSIWCAAAFILVMLFLGSAGVHVQEAFQVLQNASLAHYQLAYMAMFAIPLVGASALRTRLPAWLKWTSILGLAGTVFSFALSSYPFVDVVNPSAYAAKVVGTTLVSNSFAFAYYKWRQRKLAVLQPVAIERVGS